MELTLGRRRPLPGAIELPGARRRRLAAERRTRALGASALVTTGALVGTEVARVWRRRPSPQPAEGAALFEGGAGALAEVMEVAVEGYRGGSLRENALLNLLGSFSLTWAITRVSVHVIRRRGEVGPFRHLVLGDRHIHHFVPGIALAFVAGGLAVVSRSERLDTWLALPFGMGVALTIDESALLLKLDDVYWTEEGIVSVQIGFAALAMVSALALALRVLRRGEAAVLGYAAPASAPNDSPTPSPQIT